MSWQKIIHSLKSTFLKDDGPKKKKSSIQTLVILLIIGIGLMLLSHFYSPPPDGKDTSTLPVGNQADATKDLETFKENQQKSFASLDEYASYYQDNLTDILNEVMGVSNAHVLVALDTTIQNVYAENRETKSNRTTEKDNNGGTRQSNEENRTDDVVTIEGANGQEPIIVTKKSPIVKGVLVVADGVQNPTVKSWVTEAVSTVLDIPDYKVSVTQGKPKEE